MTSTYSTHAAICAKFYTLTLDAHKVAHFVIDKAGVQPGARALFIGGMFEIAAELSLKGFELTLVDYTDEMVALAAKRLPDCRVVRADLRELCFDQEFDAIFVVGRVFTHMTTDIDLRAALESCHKALKPSGILMADNYEDTKIQVTNYFNGRIDVRDEGSVISRISSTRKVSDSPYVVNWRATYSGEIAQEPFAFDDEIDHRAFSRAEFAMHLSQFGFRVIAQGDNFDETSFYSVARRV